MGSNKTLSQTCVKINNTFFDIVEKSFKIKKGYGSVDNVPTVGEGGKIIRNVVEKIEDKIATGSFQIVNTVDNQNKIDSLMQNRHALTIEGIDPNGSYKPVTNASIVNDPEWQGGGEGIDIEFAGDAVEKA